MRIIGAEGTWLARMYYAGQLTRTIFFENPCRYDQGSRGRTVVVKTGGLPGQPTDCPYVIVRAVIQPLIPALVGPQPHLVNPPIRRHKQRDDAGEFLRCF